MATILTHSRTLTAFADRATSTQARRLKRIAERHAHTTCFACREVGHSAQDCPTVTRPEDDGDEGGTTKTGTTAAAVVGICYRCGSRKHNLARCRKPPVRPDDPLPFASCFVCSGRGHLAGSCPKNNGKGVYPNGGSCKLCGETTHLARDCTLRKIGSSSALPYPFFFPFETDFGETPVPSFFLFFFLSLRDE
jgi:zinc finger CCHC domain-containing protein 9